MLETHYCILTGVEFDQRFHIRHIGGEVEFFVVFDKESHVAVKRRAVDLGKPHDF